MPNCSDCEQDLPKKDFSKAQLRKTKDPKRCRDCAAKLNANLPSVGEGMLSEEPEAKVRDEVENAGADEDVNVSVNTTSSTAVDDSILAKNETVEKPKSEPVTEKNLNIEDSKDSSLQDEGAPVISGSNEEKQEEKDSKPEEDPGFVPNALDENKVLIETLPESTKEEKDDSELSPNKQENDTNIANIDTALPNDSGISTPSSEMTASTTQELTNEGSKATTNEAMRENMMELPPSLETIPSASFHAEDEDQPSKPIQLAICAMDKKARSKPMSEILERLDKKAFQVIYFGDEMILNAPVEEWPTCDVLIAFYSDGYPLEKAEAYAELRKPFVLNDLKMQRTLMDRRRVYDLLEASGIDVPRHVFMNRDGYVSSDGMTRGGTVEEDLFEHDDHIEIDGIVINKPFVEKPVDADDHNIAIYYPASAGGGCKKLFRKIGDRSSEFYPDINEVRREGSFIYEEFIETQGTDVKMYTVGPDYGHAEARKSPTVDGKVERNSDGKEVRFPVILTLREKEIARRIVTVFKQQVCGFDLLRVQEGNSLVSYVCDVNGWSFVKNSRKYYDDCATILKEHMLAKMKPELLQSFSALYPLVNTTKSMLSRTVSNEIDGSNHTLPITNGQALVSDQSFNDQGSPNDSDAATLEDGAVHVRELPDTLLSGPCAINSSNSVTAEDEKVPKRKQKTTTQQEELRCVITVIRHGDRTPKQKLKVKLSEPLILKYFHAHTDRPKKNLKIKDKNSMREFLETVKMNIKVKEETPESDRSAKDVDLLQKLLHMRDVLERWKIGGLNRKLQLKPEKWEDLSNEDGHTIVRCTKLQLILKWGGNLTKLGEKQSITLGKNLRTHMYPNAYGGGILRLHSTFRHDLKIKTSDEGRVMKTAAAFAKGLLELEGEIPPILISLVHKEKGSQHMLDPSGNTEVKKELEAVKSQVNEALQQDFNAKNSSPKQIKKIVDPKMSKSLIKALQAVGNPKQNLLEIRSTIGELLEKLDEMLGLMGCDENKNEGGEGLKGDGEQDEALSGIKLYKGETLLELTERWRLLYTKLYDEEMDVFDLSRVPDVHDNVRFDMLHNPHLGLTKTLSKLYKLAKLMADCVVPQEYGLTEEGKRSIGKKMCSALLEKIKYDLMVARTDNQVDMRYLISMDYSDDLPINTMGRRIRTRLYFTSESHLHTLLNVLRFSSFEDKNLLSKQGIKLIDSAPELCYLTQIVIRLFENTEKDVDDPKRFRVEISFSPGASATPLHMSELSRDSDASRFDTEALGCISKNNLTCHEVEDYFSEIIKEGKSKDDDNDEEEIQVPKPPTDEAVKTSEVEKPSTPKKVNPSAAKKTKRKQGSKQAERISTSPVKERFIPEAISETKGVKIITDLMNLASKGDDQAQNGAPKPIVSAMKKEKKETPPIRERKKSVTIAEEKNTEIEPVEESEGSDDEEPESDTDCAGDSETSNVEERHIVLDESVDEEDIERIERMAKALAKQYFWSGVAAVSFVVGIGCLFLSKEVQNDFKARRWSSRR